MGIIQAVPQDRVAIVEKFGRFEAIAKPGFLFRPFPGVWNVAGYLSTRLQAIHVKVETKTKDNVFVKVVVAVHLEILKDEQAQYDAFYRLASPEHQIQSYVEDAVRKTVPTIELDNVFFQKQQIAEKIFETLEPEMKSYGYKIWASLIIDIDPAVDVKISMNSINAEKRLRIAQGERAEAEKYMQIKKAEALSEATFLSGEGLARQRKAIIDGTRESVSKFEETLVNRSSKEVMDLLLVTQYFDTMKELAQGQSSNVVFLPKRKIKRRSDSPTSSLSEVMQAVSGGGGQKKRNS